ncbi:MAG: glycosyltransferase family 4 protein [Candidatus Kerfeldbacteria bacterium]|nr:glycosyltransferase family 4 protein [Candidatus Kerfeldbacteria bacterium]
MKILQINKFFYRRAGAENYFLDVSRALEQAGHEMAFFSMHHPQNVPSPYAKYFIDEIDFGSGAQRSIQKAAHFIYSTEAAKKLEQLITDHRPDIAHVHNIAHQLTPSVLDTLRKHHIPVVMTLHDYQVLCPNYKLFTQGSPCERCKVHQYWNAIKFNCVQDAKLPSALSAVEMAVQNVFKKTYAKGVNIFIAPSQFMYTKMNEWGWPESQLHYLPNFIDRIRDTRIKKKNQFAYIGRLTKEKGVHLVLEAARRMQDTTFIFAGSGEEESNMKATIQKEGLKNCVMLGFQPEHKIDTLIQESQAVLVPSLWWENAPLSVYEALALGTPVIASNRGGLPELIKKGKNGIIFNPEKSNALAEAIQQMLAMPPLQIPKNTYTVGSHVEALTALYEKTIRQKK